ncbi:MAG: DUF2490 domain-containing protein [Cycloclasticus sp.]|jgi:hypothetical protein|nr:DUF2490 domain-containing protein [Cycloclasticus sp.]
MFVNLNRFILMSLVVWCFSFSCLATESQLKVNKKAVIKGVAFKGDIEARRDKGILHRKHADIGVRLPLAIKDLTLGVHYRRVYSLEEDGWALENRPYVQLEQKFKGNNKLDWRLRVRQEFRDREGKGHSKRSRVRAKVVLPKRIFNAKPFVSHEYYYDLTAHQLSQTRVDMGVTFDKFKTVVPQLSFKIVAKQKDKWQTSSAIVLSLAF